jgi:hypothetical protein
MQISADPECKGANQGLMALYKPPKGIGSAIQSMHDKFCIWNIADMQGFNGVCVHGAF